MNCIGTGKADYNQVYFPYQGFTSLSILFNVKSNSIVDPTTSASISLCTNSTSFFSSTVTSTCKNFYNFYQFIKMT